MTPELALEARADFAGTSVALQAESAYGEILHDALEGEGIRVSQLDIPGDRFQSSNQSVESAGSIPSARYEDHRRA